MAEGGYSWKTGEWCDQSCVKWSIYFHIGKQRCHSHWQMQPSGVSWWALREFRKEKNTCDLTAIKPAGLLWTGNVKTQELAPDSRDTYETDDFSEPRCLHLPIQRKLNSLTWAIWFSFVNSHLWCSDYLPPSLRTFLSPDSFPWLRRAVSQATWDVAPQAWSPKNSHQIKQYATFRLRLYFLSR